MENSFILNITHNGKTEQLQAKLVRLGFTYQFHISIMGRTLIFEQDEERNYRVIDTDNRGKKIEADFLQTIIYKLSDI